MELDPVTDQPDQETEEVKVRVEVAREQVARPAETKAAVNERLRSHVQENTTTIL